MNGRYYAAPSGYSGEVTLVWLKDTFDEVDINKPDDALDLDSIE